jgi:hypothetical protein
MWICPECNRRDGLTVTVVSSANLTQDDNDDNFETEIQGDHEWDGDSTMSCDNCGHVGTARQFECNLPIANLQHPDGPMPRRRHTDGK